MLYIDKAMSTALVITLCIFLNFACSRKERLENIPRPHDLDQVCIILDHDRIWKQSLLRVKREWGVPIELVLAIIRHESSFRAHARPHHKRHQFRLFSRGRTSSAYGYAQVLDRTWRWYKSKTRNSDHRRDHFPHAVNFVGWYLHITHTMLHIPFEDYKSHYLAYHEGHHGFKEKSYARKKRLINYTQEINQTAKRYHKQLKRCKLSTP